MPAVISSLAVAIMTPNGPKRSGHGSAGQVGPAGTHVSCTVLHSTVNERFGHSRYRRSYDQSRSGYNKRSVAIAVQYVNRMYGTTFPIHYR